MISVWKMCLWFWLLLWLPMVNAVAQPDLTVGIASVRPSATVTLPVSFTNNGGVVAISFDITYDPARVTPGTVTAGAGLAPHTVATNIPAAGTLRVLINPPLVNPMPTVNSGVLLTIPWTMAANAAPASIPLTLTNVAFANAAAGAVPAGALTSGQLTP